MDHQEPVRSSICNSEKKFPLIGIASLSACKSKIFMMAEGSAPLCLLHFFAARMCSLST